jgi:bacillithiol system protein YtxJ
MNWNILSSSEQLKFINELSHTKPVLILKHSTRCSISSAALSRFERSWKEENKDIVAPYYLDLLAHRDVSNLIASKYHIEHESPQALLIKNGQCVFSQTHMGISVADILEATQ